MSKSTLKDRFFSKRMKNQAKQCEDLSRILDLLWFQVGMNSFQSEKTSVQVSAAPKLTMSL